MAVDLKSRTVTFVGIGIATALAAGVGYYVYEYKDQRQHYFTETRRRQLAVLGEQIEGAIDNRFTQLANAVRNANELQRVQQFEMQLTRTKFGKVACQDGSAIAAMPVVPPRAEQTPGKPLQTEDAKAREAPAQSASAAIPGATAAPGKTPTATGPRVLFDDAAEDVQPHETSRLDFRSSTRVGSPMRKRNAGIRFCYDYCADPQNHDDCKGTLPIDRYVCGGAAVCASTSLGDVAGPLLHDEGDAAQSQGDGFDAGDFFIARGAKVMYESGNSDIRIGSVLEGPKLDAKGGGAATATPVTVAGPFPSADELRQASLVRDVFLGGEPYRLFAHPVHVNADDQSWVLGFLVERQRFDRRVAALSFGSLSYAPLVLLIAVLAAPLLKIHTMGQRERLTTIDVRVLAFSLIALAGTVTALGLAIYGYAQLGRVLDGELASLSLRLRRNFHEELSQAASALRHFADEHARERASTNSSSDNSSGVIETGIFNYCRDLDDGLPRAHCALKSCDASGDEGRNGGDSCPAASLAGELRQIYPFFDMLSWSDRTGQQKEKWSVGDAATPFRNIADTNFYRDVKDGRLWKLKSFFPAKPLAFHLRFSSNTGDLIPVIAVPLETRLAAEAGDGKAANGLVGNASMIPEMSSLLRPVLPQGFSFAVIELDGKVVAHSVRSRNLYENFFEECDCAGAVRAAVESRGVQVVSGTYRGRAQSFYVHPIEDSPWTLIVFRDREVPRTILLDGLLAWLALYAVYLAFAVAGVTILKLLVGYDRAEWIWPAGDCEASYSTSLLALISTSVLFLTVIIEPSGSARALLGTSLALPLAAAGHVYLRLLWSPLAARPKTAPHWPAWGAIAVAFILAVWTTRDDATAMLLAVGAVVLLALLAKPAAHVISSWPSAWSVVAIAAAAGAVWAMLLGKSVVAAFYVLFALGCAVVAWDKWRVEDPKAQPTRRLFEWKGTLRLLEWKRTHRLPGWKFTYGWAGVVLVIVLGVLPSAAFYQDVWDESLEVFVRHGQMKTAERLDERWLRIAKVYKDRKHAAPADVRNERLRRQNLEQLRDLRLSKTWDVVTGDFFGAPYAGCTPDRGGLSGLIGSGKADASSEFDARSRRISGNHFSGRISDALPAYHDESIQLRELVDTRAADGRWSWQVYNAKGAAACPQPPAGNGRHGVQNPQCAEFCWTAPRGDGEYADFALRAAWPPLAVNMDSPQKVLLLLVLLVMLLAGCFLIVRWLMRAVLGVDVLYLPEGESSREPNFGRGVLVLRQRAVTDGFGNDVRVVDLRSPPREDDWHDSIPDDVKTILLKHLEERLEDLPSVESTLRLLESLVLRQKRLVVIVCTVAPLSYLRRRLQSNADVEADKFITPEVIGRWARLLERLVRVDADDVWPLSLPELIKWFLALPPAALYRHYGDAAIFGPFVDEISQTPRLRGIAWEILWQRQIRSWKRSTPSVPPETIADLARKDDVSLAREHALERLDKVRDNETVQATLADAARAHYRALWSHLTDDEQLTLVQLAKEGYVNPKGWRLVNGLLRLGLIRHTPAVRLMNESFRRFAASEETDTQVRHWETADGRSGWDRARRAILILLIAAGLLLYFTQPERLTQMGGGIAAIGAAAATVANMLGLFRGGGSASGAKT